MSVGTPHRREKLPTLLWSEADDDNARSYLRQSDECRRYLHVDDCPPIH
jgi:hypothetical protein